MEQLWLKNLATSELNGSKWIIREEFDHSAAVTSFLFATLEQLFKGISEAATTYNRYKTHNRMLRAIALKEEKSTQLSGFILMIGKQQLQVFMDKRGLVIQRIIVSGYKSSKQEIGIITPRIDQFGGCDLKIGEATVTTAEIIRKMLVSIHSMTFTYGKEDEEG
jgi:hypothetical protein